MQIHYKILKEKNLLIQKYVGSFSIRTYTSYVKKVKKHNDADLVEKILTDMREATPNNVLKRLDFLIKFRQTVIKKSYKNVFLVNNPSNTVATYLYQNEGNNKKYPYKYCSTIEKALKDLDLLEDREEIESILESLGNSTEKEQ